MLFESLSEVKDLAISGNETDKRDKRTSKTSQVLKDITSTKRNTEPLELRFAKKLSST